MTEGIKAIFSLTDAHSSKDIDYHRLFSEPLTKPGGTNSYEGYLRALQLYGREGQLVNSHKVHRYDRWVARYPELHQSYQDQARQDGYNPSGGSLNPFTGTCFPNPSLDGPSLNQADTDPSVIYPHTPQRQGTLTQTQTSPSSLATEAIADDMAPPRRDASGRFTPGECIRISHRKCQAENALLLAELIKKLLNNKITTELRQETKPILTTMRDIKGLTASVTKIKAEQAPQPSNQLGSALGAIHHSGGSTKNVAQSLDNSHNDADPPDKKHMPTQTSSSQTPTAQTSSDKPKDRSERDTMAPPRRTPRNSSGRFAASEDVFSYHTGNVKVKTGQSARNAIGATENALLLADIFKKLIDADIPQSCYERPVTPAEGFVPIQIVADKLTQITHLGQPWKPLIVSNGHKWPPVISAEDARKLRWETCDQIGQPSQDN
ncbi:hypothetical protein FOXYS1_7904 [Fusarium oxysporum]|uniref:Uncharacterized protein n=1 Tax=Fusarium oxysporum TaxID=5507 RepID=A0A8H5AA49_FUSOX|nr:hypothetical protein FOXYS1_7904 [Fusarium oxysporum]